MTTPAHLRIAITGSSGLVARALVPFLAQAGHEVYALHRTDTIPPPDSPQPLWNVDSGTVSTAAPPDILVHLAGQTIATRWTKRTRREIWDSRVPATQRLAAFLASLPEDRRPRTLIAASAIGIYGSRGDELLIESSPLAAPGSCFLSDLCLQWEAATQTAADAGIRVVTVRLGHVLARGGGLLGKLAGPVKWGLGGPIGSGMQWMPWIARHDLCRLIQRAATDETIRGIINAVTPNPVRQHEFIRTLGKVLHRPTVFPLPSVLVKLIFGQMGKEALLGSQRVIATRLPADFAFDYPILESALRAELTPAAT